jgi:enoyl-CoA hydratase
VVIPRRQQEEQMSSYQYLAYELLDEGTIARIMLNRPVSRNAQNRVLMC